MKLKYPKFARYFEDIELLSEQFSKNCRRNVRINQTKVMSRDILPLQKGKRKKKSVLRPDKLLLLWILYSGNLGMLATQNVCTYKCKIYVVFEGVSG